LRGIPFGNILIKRVVTELAAELPNIKAYSNLSPLPRFSQAQRDTKNEHGFTPARLAALLVGYAPALQLDSTRSVQQSPQTSLFALRVGINASICTESIPRNPI
jgi:Malonyl-CoA decarboxylase C-terminal domain